MVALGIDLGTTNCRMAVWRNNKVEILENDLGKRATPSVVGFIEGNIVVGEGASRDRVRYPESVIYDVKRIIGLNRKDEGFRNTMKRLSYDIITYPKLKVVVNRTTVLYTPEEISAKVLKYMKDCAEKRLNTKIVEAVITVPTYFNHFQRQATKEAAKIAGFNSIRLLHECTAAAIQYGIENNISDGRILLVFHLGRREFEVSVVKYDNHVFEELAADGDQNLGGEDIDQVLMDYIIRENGLDRNIKRIIARVRRLAEVAKIDLSTKQHTQLELFFAPCDYGRDMDISRSTFNKLIKNIIDKTMSIVENCLTRQKMLNLKIDDVLLVGGSTKIPKIKELLYKRFGKPSKYNDNVEETVVAGAAIWAAHLYDGAFQDSKISNTCPFSLGVETKNGKMSKFIEKFSALPISATKWYKTIAKNQTKITIKIYSGESENVSENCFLGEFTVLNIASSPRGTFLTETFTVDENGILTVTAIDESGNNNKFCVSLGIGNFSNDEITRLNKESNIQLDRSEDIAIAKKYKHDIEELIPKIAAKNITLYNCTNKWLGGIGNLPDDRNIVEENLEALRAVEKKFETLTKIIQK